MATITAPEVVARERGGRVSASVTDNVAVASVELRLGGTSLGRFTAPPYEVDLAVPAAARSGDTLTLSLSATDTAGNTTTVSRGVRVAAAGVVVGQVLDAATGLPLQGATVRLLSGSAGISTETDERGRFSLPAEDARIALRAERAGFLPVDREASVVSSVGNVVVDARLARLAPAVAVDAAGGSLGAAVAGVSEPSVSVQVPAGAVSSANLRLTVVAAQALPGLLPLGFSPVAAFDVRSDEGVPLVQPLPATVTGLPASALQLVAYRASTHGWFVLARDLAATDGRLAMSLPWFSTYALVVADGGEPAVAVAEPGQDLLGGEFVALPPDARSAGVVQPATLPPGGGTAQGQLSLITSALLPSGSVVQAEITETYTLASGEVASEEKRLVDVVLFRAGAPEGTVVTARFPITPSKSFAAADLVEGRVHLDILAGREGMRGRTGGNEALTLNDGNLAVSLASGSLEHDTAVTLRASELSSFLPQAAGLTALREGVLDLAGARLSVAAELSIDAGIVPTGGTLLIARVERVEGVPRLVVVALAAVVGDRVVSVAYPGCRAFAAKGGTSSCGTRPASDSSREPCRRPRARSRRSFRRTSCRSCP